jgi:DNA polymerase III subunit beta
MKFSCNSNTLQKTIGIVEKAVSQRSSLPVLENIYLEIKEGTLKLRGNDLEIGIENSLSLESVESEGQVLIKAKTISSILSKIQDQNLNFEIDEKNKMNIHGNKIDFEILGTNATEYPAFPEIEDGTILELTVSELRQLIRLTIFAVSFDETKQFLNGILIKNDNDTLNFVSTDGYRLSLKKQVIKAQDKTFSIITPYKAVNELNKILQGKNEDEIVTIIISEKQISFKMDDFLLISRVIQGQFPDYNQVIPKESSHSYVVPRRLLQIASERASIIASASNNVIRLSFTESKLVIKSNAASLGEFTEELDIKRVEGTEDQRIAFNVKLLLDAIKTLECEDVRLSFSSELSPCKVQPLDDDSYMYIIMPIRTSEYQDS